MMSTIPHIFNKTPRNFRGNFAPQDETAHHRCDVPVGMRDDPSQWLIIADPFWRHVDFDPCWYSNDKRQTWPKHHLEFDWTIACWKWLSHIWSSFPPCSFLCFSKLFIMSSWLLFSIFPWRHAAPGPPRRQIRCWRCRRWTWTREEAAWPGHRRQRQGCNGGGCKGGAPQKVMPSSLAKLVYN